MRARGIKLVALPALAMACLLFVPTIASAAIGDLTPQGCFQDAGPPDSHCATGAENPGLYAADSVAVSPDGKSVYVASTGDGAIAMFKRNPSTGALTSDGCIADSDTFAGSGCADFADGMAAPNGIVVSPDGLDVYVVANADDSVVHLERDTATGDLTPAECIANTGDTAGCGGLTQKGLDSGRAITIDPDGSAVYVAGGTGGGTGSVVRIARNTSTGVLSPGACISNTPDAFACGAETPGLSNANDIAISADGESLHVASRGGAVASFGAPGLSPLGCFADTDSPIVGCSPAQGLAGAKGIAVSPDGKSVYARSDSDAAVVRFNRSNTGSLTSAGCIADTESATNCGGAKADGLSTGTAIAVSPDNVSVYAVGGSPDQAIVSFDRDTGTGAIADGGCINETGAAGCESTTYGLMGGSGVTVSPDGKSVYVTSTGSSALTRFDRESEAVEPPPNEVQVRTKKATCKGTCKAVKVKTEVAGPGTLTFCNAPAGVNAPCKIAGKALAVPAKGASKSIKTETIDVAAAATVSAKLKLTPKAKKTLKKKGKLKVKLQVDFTPTGGELNSDRQTVTIKRSR
ncbi:MAG: beta-propeller fold lactonase family protein [Solirubrobacterales bacterium]